MQRYIANHERLLLSETRVLRRSRISLFAGSSNSATNITSICAEKTGGVKIFPVFVELGP
jgi:hypothetical protein